MSDLRLHVEDRELAASWTDENPETRAAITGALPFGGEATRWGDELYVETPVDVPLENGRRTVPEGSIAYWPRGNALCLFWGPTPASDGDEPRAASEVAVVATVADVSPLADLDGGATLRVEQTD